MQLFGKFLTNFDMDYLAEHYMYINKDEDDKITTDDLENMLKKKRKTVAAPIGYKFSRFLQDDGFDDYDKFIALTETQRDYILNAGLKQNYKGKLIEIKYLFSYNKENIEPTLVLEEFDADLDKFTSSQFTRYDKKLNYLDIPNIRLSGKFVFFGIGHKYDRHHKAIIAYATALSKHIQKLDKEIVFMYDNNYDIDEAKDRAYFLSPFAAGKAKEKRANGFKKVFSTNPPKIIKIS